MVDDEEYAAAMLAILANPSPTGIDPDDPYGQADDGIDRNDGFGRDVWVESVQLTHGDHGAELDVGFRLDLPEELAVDGMPSRGSVRVPVDQEWRELSGYQEPRSYAPAVARKVEWAAHGMVERHRSRMRAGPTPTPTPAEQGTLWPRLLAGLSEHGNPVEVAPGRVELGSSTGAITFLVSPDAWEQVVAVHAGNDIELYLDELLAPRQEDEVFVVFYEGDLARSTRANLPPVRGQAQARRLAEHRAANPGATYGWSANTPPDPTGGGA